MLVVFIKHEAQDVLMIAIVVARAARVCLRAILRTTATTAAGVFPILTETSLQAQILTPLVAGIVFGLLATSLILLFAVPAIYMTLDGLGLSAPAQNGGKSRLGCHCGAVDLARGPKLHLALEHRSAG